ncbi:MAG: bifunctional aldolase/short-chain dehydrogenase [bacterium]|nr:bifunctional aldolase/short-chain dehydrogenase [bacterium]
MKNRYQSSDAAAFVRQHAEIPDSLALRIYTSRLLGSEPSLVLHGGGNTSVKLRAPDLLGNEQEVLCVKASGSSLATIEASGFAAMDLADLRKLRGLDALDEEELENQLMTHRLRADAASPSVETLLHAFLPHRFVEHTHADAILVLSNREPLEDQLRESLGENVAVLPYLMPGLPLARQVADCHDAHPGAEAIISLNHGLFTFGDDAETAYTRMIETVDRAERVVASRTGRSVVPREGREAAEPPPEPELATNAARVLQCLRGVCSSADETGKRSRLVAELRSNPEMAEISQHAEAPAFCRSGVLTPDHVIRTGNEILYLGQSSGSDDLLRERIATEVAQYRERYDAYFRSQSAALHVARRRLDSTPRLVLVAGVGLIGLGSTRSAARVAADIGEHQLRAKVLTHALGGHVAIALNHIFEMEYWTLQRKKLGARPRPPLEGQVAVVTGAGGAIGAGIADRLLAAGAVVAIADLDRARLEAVEEILSENHDPRRIESLSFDVTDFDSVAHAFESLSLRFGGVDIVVPNAGIAHVATIEELDPKRFEQVLAVNLAGAFNTMKASIPIFRRQQSGGNIVLISSKNVPDPGAAFGAYSASKAGAHQIGKIAALELAELGVRVNMVNPDAVFGDERISSGLWDLIGPDRMKSRGLDPEGLRDYYRERNLLKTSVLAEHVGNVVVFFASEQSPTTGASFPVDGGVPSAFPR